MSYCPRLVACLAGALFGAGLALPLAAEEERVYRVEILLFHQGTAPGGVGERWPARPSLTYPGEARFLIDRTRHDTLLEEFPGDLEIDPFGRLLISQQSTAGEDIPRPLEALPQSQTAEAQELAEQQVEDQDEPLYEPFVLLDPADYLLADGASRLARSGREILFHGAWMQVVAEERAALPIILDHSGDSGQWPQWQGSIELFLSRYLHLETSLWLNTQGEYLSGGWSLPAPPLGPPSILVDGISAAELRNPPPEVGPAAGAITGNPLFSNEGTPPDSGLSGANRPDGSAQQTPAAEKAAWPYRHAVLFNERRRMRSGETHYLDHPLLGLLVRIDPVDLEALAEARDRERELAGDALPGSETQGQ